MAQPLIAEEESGCVAAVADQNSLEGHLQQSGICRRRAEEELVSPRFRSFRLRGGHRAKADPVRVLSKLLVSIPTIEGCEALVPFQH
jgi:hypothetical protein